LSIYKNALLKYAKAILFSLSTALVLVFTFAAVSAIFRVGSGVLTLFQILIRMASVGVFAFIFSDGSAGILKGAISGISVFLMLFIFFLLLSGGVPSGKIGLGALFTVVFGIIFGIIFANLKKAVNNS